MNERILFKLATRSRPLKAKAAIDNIIENCNSDNYLILVSCDGNDEYNTYEVLKDYINNSGYKYIFIENGHSFNKIDAINRDLKYTKYLDTCKILVNTSDDMVFTTKGFDDIIRQDFTGNYDQVLHYNDGNQKSNVMTLSIMGVEYYNRFNYIYHPSYQSLFCDQEATDVAHMLGKYKYMGDDKILFRHMHPAWGLAEYDEQYRKTEATAMWSADEKVYNERKARNYDLPEHLIINKSRY